MSGKPPRIIIPDRRLIKPIGQLYPQDQLLPPGYASIAVLNERSDTLKPFGPGGAWGIIDGFANTAHVWLPDGPEFVATDNAAITTSGSADVDTNDVTQFLWVRFKDSAADLYNNSSVAYAYLTYCNGFRSHSFRLTLSGAASINYDAVVNNESSPTQKSTDWCLGRGKRLFDGQWHLVTHSRVGSTQATEVWIDNTLELYGTLANAAASDVLCFGGRDDSASRSGQCQVGICGYYDRALTEAEIKQIYYAGFDAYSPANDPIALFLTPDVTAGTITGTGALAAQTSSVAGTGEVEHTGTGALTAQASAIAGTGTVSGVVTGTGAIAAQISQVAGTGEITHTGTGDIDAQASSISGTGAVSGAVTGTGDLDAQASAISGVGEITHTGTGDLDAQASTIAGVGQVGAITTGTGDLDAQVSSVSGTGAVTKTGFGDLDAQISVVSGTGTITKVGTGDLDAQVSAISGTGAVTQTITGTGALVAGSSNIDGYDVLRIWTEVGDVTSTWTEVTDTTSIWTEVT